MIEPCILINTDSEFDLILKDYLKTSSSFYIKQSFPDLQTALNEISADCDISIALIRIDKESIGWLEHVLKLTGLVKAIILLSTDRSIASIVLDRDLADFIPLPATPWRLKKAIERSQKILLEKAAEPKNEDFFYVRVDKKRTQRISYENVLAFEIYENTLTIHLTKGTVQSKTSLSSIEQRLNGNENFIKVHRSFIVAWQHIEMIEEGSIYFSNSKLRIKIGPHFHEDFWDYVGKHMLIKNTLKMK